MYRAVALFSGGKDSVFAATWALWQGFDLSLITVVSEDDSYMFHHPNTKWTSLQAEALHLPHFFIYTDNKKEIIDLKNTISRLNVDAIISGALASEYQRQRLEKIAEELSIGIHSPLWHKEKILMDEMVKWMDVVLVSVSAEGLGKEYLTKPLSYFIDNMPKGVHPLLEGGEGETFVLDAPSFEKKIVVDEWKINWEGIRGNAEIIRAHLETK